RLQKAQEEHRSVEVEKVHLEKKLQDEISIAKQEAHRLRELREGTENELSRQKYAEQELEQVSLTWAGTCTPLALRAHSSVTTPFPLFPHVQAAAGTVPVSAHPGCPWPGGNFWLSSSCDLSLLILQAEKIKKKRNTLFGTFHVAHSSSLDDVDHKILTAKDTSWPSLLVTGSTTPRVAVPALPSPEPTEGRLSMDHPVPVSPQLLELVSQGWVTLSPSLQQLGASPGCSPALPSTVRQRLVEPQHGHGSQRDLTRCDSDSSIPHLSDHQRIPSSAPKLLAARPTLLTRSMEEAVPGPPGPGAPTPNGGSRHGEPSALAALQERLPESPMAMKKMMTVNHGMEKSSSLGEISHQPTGGRPSHSDSSRSHSPSSTDPDTPSPISDCRPGGARNTRIPQLAAKKSPGDEDSSLTGDEVDLGQSKKKFPLKIFKKPKK
ncbi:STIM1 protein, partial [Calcarius ornatus]|nr:STIM1 protein [Calcarius ornatus]